MGTWLFTKSSNISVFASPPAPAPKCYVSGVIQDVRFEKAHDNPCVKSNSCPTDVQLSYPDTYYLSVKIQSVSLKDGDTRFQTCDSLYQTGSTREIFITKDKVKPGDVFGKGQVITGTAVSFWGNSFETYSIGDEKTLPETPPIGQKPPSVFEKMKLFISGVLNLISNFLYGVKTTGSTTKSNY